MGHANPTLTLSPYSHATLDRQRTAAEVLATLDDLDIEFGSPADCATDVPDLNAPCCGEARRSESIGVDRGRRPVGTVGSDHGMEVHQSPALELGHLGVLEA